MCLRGAKVSELGWVQVAAGTARSGCGAAGSSQIGTGFLNLGMFLTKLAWIFLGGYVFQKNFYNLRILFK